MLTRSGVGLRVWNGVHAGNGAQSWRDVCGVPHGWRPVPLDGDGQLAKVEGRCQLDDGYDGRDRYVGGRTLRGVS